MCYSREDKLKHIHSNLKMYISKFDVRSRLAQIGYVVYQSVRLDKMNTLVSFYVSIVILSKFFAKSDSYFRMTSYDLSKGR